MKITALRTEVVHIPFNPIIGHALRSADCVLAYLETDAGLVGEGFVCTLNAQRIRVIDEMVKSLEPLVLGLDPQLGGSFSARAWADVGFIGHAGVSLMGIAAVDCALWDLRGKAAGMNVSRLIGACATAVPVYNSGGLWGSRSLDELQRQAADHVKAGWRAMKVRIGANIEDAVARVRVVREAIGPDIALMADPHQAYSVPQAIRLGRMLEPYNLAWFEEPTAPEDHAGEAAIAAALDTPIASGESVYPRGIHDMLRQRSADILMPDMQRMGGPTQFLKIAHLAEAYDTSISPHHLHQMSIALVASLNNAIYLEYMPWFDPLFGDNIELDADGRAIVPTRPGWGFPFDQKAVKKLKVS
ncbi:MAG: mandelate racemase/muconate lactonizing enzyme family protein [Betaproteobacteria bacterium]|nr:mandelate racemase/muconate lactonizing enzyme family protein [Betaproteobacteria bacterium]